jgi:hypothetical protein
MGSVESATNARIMLEGKEMFPNCCQLKIIYSNLSEVNVAKNGPRGRDFTRPDAVASSTASPNTLLAGLGGMVGMPGSNPYYSMSGFAGAGGFSSLSSSASAVVTTQEKGAVIVVQKIPSLIH